MINPKSLLNLKPPWTSETAKIAGRHPKDPKQLAMNRMTTGRYITIPELKKDIALKPSEKLAGITQDEKIETYKKISRAAWSDNATEFFHGLQEETINLKVRKINMMREGTLKNELYWDLQIWDRLERLGKLKYGLDRVNFNQMNVQNNTSISINPIQEEIEGIINKVKSVENGKDPNQKT